MQDIYLDQNFNLVFSKDLKFISGIEVQCQHLYKFFKVKKGDLPWDTDFGLDSSELLKRAKLGSVSSLQGYLINLALDMSLDIADIEITPVGNTLNIVYYFLGNTSLTTSIIFNYIN